MNDYIDRKELQKELNDWYDYHYPTASGETDKLHIDINKIVRNMPSVDAIEVVRCKDCKHREGAFCQYFYKKLFDIGCTIHAVVDNDYCARGEKE
jgi:hypothetical protein